MRRSAAGRWLIERGSTSATVRVRRGDRVLWDGAAECRIDTPLELEWLRAGGLFGHLLSARTDGQDPSGAGSG
ncbi:hypothetical protein ABZ918_20195 [Streptomyces viridosporus]|uniref:hypothetical protein n=1 Tax=Streptomyces viridosporus TaxID=67581 RepID=UPI00342F91CD